MSACDGICQELQVTNATRMANIAIVLDMATDLTKTTAFGRWWSYDDGKTSRDCWRRVTTRHGKCLVSDIRDQG